MTVINTPVGIGRFQLLALRGAVRLEIAGMHRRSLPATVVARELLGLPRSTKKTDVLAALNTILGA
jgi:hypothetical protein